MIVEKQEPKTPAGQPLLGGRPFPWFRILISLLLGGLGLWFVFRDTSQAAVVAAIQQARPGFVLLAFLNIGLTGVVKAWRWQHLFSRQHRPPFTAVFWTVHLAQLANTAVPFIRVNEVVRVLDLDRRSQVGKTRVLGSLVIEKTLELVLLALTVFLLLPYLVLPDYIRDSRLGFAAVSFTVFAILWLLAYQTEMVIRLFNFLLRPLPARLSQRLLPLVTAGLEGLASLRERRSVVAILASSVLVAFLYILTPYLLLHAFNIPLGLAEAASIHVVLNIGTIPSWAPANVGIFEFLVALMLRQFNQTDSGVIAGYTLLLHLVIVLPQIVIGGLAALRGGRGQLTSPTTNEGV